jgi:hypothetical protein
MSNIPTKGKLRTKFSFEISIDDRGFIYLRPTQPGGEIFFHASDAEAFFGAVRDIAKAVSDSGSKPK